MGCSCSKQDPVKLRGQAAFDGVHPQGLKPTLSCDECAMSTMATNYDESITSAACKLAAAFLKSTLENSLKSDSEDELKSTPHMSKPLNAWDSSELRLPPDRLMETHTAGFCKESDPPCQDCQTYVTCDRFSPRSASFPAAEAHTDDKQLPLTCNVFGPDPPNDPATSSSPCKETRDTVIKSLPPLRTGFQLLTLNAPFKAMNWAHHFQTCCYPKLDSDLTF